MCGFVGIFDIENFLGKHSIFMDFAMNDLYRRGPDSQNTWKSDNEKLELGFARLAIRDLSEFGTQPMHSKDGRYTIVYNGETYNTNELAQFSGIEKELLLGSSDTEIILESIAKIGLKKVLERMDGIFAFALFDSLENKLFLVRDRAGVKPLYMGIKGGLIVFSSHYHHITSHDIFRSEEIMQSPLENYFRYGFIQEGEGLIKHTYFLPHGFVTTIDLNDLKWGWSSFLETKNRTIVNENDLVNISKSVIESQLISDVPIGCFLSGGVDSTFITQMSAQIDPTISGVTLGVNDIRYDESEEAIQTAEKLDINHVIAKFSENELPQILNDYRKSLCEPLADPSSILTLKVCEVAKRNVTVVLSGDGADELFWGYPRFFEAFRLISFFKIPKWRRVLRVLGSKLFTGRINLSLSLIRFKNFDEYYLNKQGLPGNIIWVKELFNKSLINEHPMMYHLTDNSDFMGRARQIEFNIHLQRVLIKVDRASMFHSIEVRTPFLSNKFINLSKEYNYDQCVDGSVGKIPLRKINSQSASSDLNSRNSKKGFSPPIDMWLRKELKNDVEEVLFNMPKELSGLLNSNYIKKVWDEHQVGSRDNSWVIWSLFSLFVWVNDKMKSCE